MASPQVQNGFTRIANELLDHLLQQRLPPNVWQVLLSIVRKTYGFNKTMDYITNSQLVEMTQLGDTVVSRALKRLRDQKMIVRDGKRIGIQKDWEKWVRPLTEPSLTVSRLANEDFKENSRTANSGEPNNLADLPTKLAKQPINISSPNVAQKKRKNISKEKRDKPTIEQTFEEWLNGVKTEYFDFSAEQLDEEWLKCRDWYADNHKEIKNPRYTFRNWMVKARTIRNQKENVKEKEEYFDQPTARKQNSGDFAEFARRSKANQASNESKTSG